jgi:hypothetical protein
MVSPRLPDTPGPSGSAPGFGRRTWVMAAAFYGACVAVATWPRILGFGSTLPTLPDPLQHLWIMRWYKACLFEGRSPILCPEVQFPTGAPLGCFSPLQFQALLYIPLSLVIASDVVCYNLLWMLGLVTTGLGTMLLASSLVRDRGCAAMGGLLAMLSTPMMMHAGGHLELIYLGSFPFFLWSWLRFVDRPGRGRLAAAAGAYIVVALCAAYYAVYAIFPAALYFAWAGWSRGRRGFGGWLADVGPRILAFSATVVPCLAIVFGNQIWAMAKGYALPRSMVEFHTFSAPLWAYACPTPLHALGRHYPSSWFASAGMTDRMGECGSYLGVVSLALLAYTAAFRVRFRRMSYWWACLALLVILGGGTSWTLLGHEIPLPGLWLKQYVPLFRPIRVPSRFNMFAAVIAATIASCGLRHLLDRLPRPALRVAALAAVAVVAVADLAMVPYFDAAMPPMPGCYAFMGETAPGEAFLEIPQFGSEGSDLNAICTYWQSIHRGRTTAGYSGQGNSVYDALITYNSPFFAEAMARPDYLEDPAHTALALGETVSFADYAWVYLKAQGLRFVVLHRRSDAGAPAEGLDRLKALLGPAKVYDDHASIVYDRDRLPRPGRPVLIATEGWRVGRWPLRQRFAGRSAKLVVYNPDASQPLRLSIEAKPARERRQVRLLFEGKELARWAATPGPYQTLECPALRLPAGLHELALKSDGIARPTSLDPNLASMGAFSFRAGKIAVEPAYDLAGR